MGDQLGQLAFGIGGGAIGSFFGMPGLGTSIGLGIGGLLFGGPEDTNRIIEGASPGTIRATNSSQGSAIPKVWGTHKLAGNVIWISDKREEKVSTSTSKQIGGKGGGATATTTRVDTKVFVSMAIGIGEGELDLFEIWANSEKVYDATAGIKRSDILPDWVFYSGSETQLPDSTWEASEGVGNVPANRGLSYIVFPDIELSVFNFNIPNFEFVVASKSAALYQASTFSALNGAGTYYDPTEGPPVDTDGRGMLVRVNDLGQTKIKTFNFFSETFESSVGIGIDGFFTNYGFDRKYIYTGDGFGNFTYIKKYDRTTGALVGTSSHTVGNSAQIWVWRKEFPIAGVTVDGQGLLYYDGNGIFGDEVIAFNPDTMVRKWILAHSTFGNGTRGDATTLDKEDGNLYILQDGNPAYLTKIDVTGTVIWSVDITASSGQQDGRIVWIRDTGNILLFNGSTVSEFDSDDGAFLDSATVPGVAVAQEMSFQNDPVDGKFWYGSTNDAVELDVFDLSYRSFVVVSGLYPVTTHNADTAVFNPYANVFYTNEFGSTLIGRFSLDLKQTGTVTLDEIVGDLCTRAGLDASEFNVTPLASQAVRGFVADKPSSRIGANLAPLMTAFFFNFAESDGQLKFKFFDDTPVATLTEDDLRTGLPKEKKDLITEQRIQEDELPDRVSVNYTDINQQFAPGSQQAKKLIVHTQNQDIFGLGALVFNSAEAFRIANRIIHEKWNRRRILTFYVPITFIKLEPTDVVQLNVTHNGVSFNPLVLITETNINGLSIEVKGVTIDSVNLAIVDSVEDTGSLNDAEQGLLTTLDTKFSFIDSVLLRDIDDDAGYYGAFGYLFDTFPGCDLLRSVDDITYGFVDRVGDRAIVGTALTVLGDFQEAATDRGNSFQVQLLDKDVTLSSISYADMLNGKNACILGNETNGWEILQFQNVTNDGEGMWTLSTLFRGRRGSEPFNAGHALGDKFIMIPTGDTGIVRMPDVSDNIGTAFFYKAVTIGQNVFEATSQQFTNNAVGKSPLAPAHFTGERQTNDDIDYDWIRRARVNGELVSYADVPLDETAETYEIDFSGSGGVVRTETVNAATTYTYSDADQVTDGVDADDITAEIYQFSTVVGRGFKSTVVTPA